MGPIDYTSQMQPANPLGAFTSALQVGAATQQLDAQRAQQAAALAQAQQQQRQAEAQQRALAELAANPNPTAADYARVSTLIPAMAENLGKAWKLLEPEQQAARLNVGYQAMAAAKANKPEIAATLLRQQAEAARNSGDTKNAEGYEGWARSIELDPSGSAKTIGLMLSATDPKFADNYGKLGAAFQAEAMAPAELRAAQAKATTAEAEAGVAGEKARLGIETLKADIEWKKQDSRIKAMNAALAKESNDLKRQELAGKLDEAKAARDQKARDIQADVDTKLGGVADNLALVKEIKRLGISGMTGVSAAVPFSESRDVVAKLNQLKSMLTLENTKFLKGAMSDADIKLLGQAATSLDVYNPAAARKELDRIEGLLKRADTQTRKQYNIPKDYTPEGVATPPPSAPVTAASRAVPIPGQAPREIVVDW